ncbi:hypothetical protein Leryth_000718 [Lithospermum erythrorhizon]|nr:hypothetical protein Leryth_000718 [Lithospermum erythrorhizon]
MGRAPCCDKANVKKGPWSAEEDAKLKEFIGKYGTGGNWISLPQKAGLRRCGKNNDIKNYWNTKLKKKLMGINYPSNQRKTTQQFQSSLQPTSQIQAQSTMMPTLSQLFTDCSPFSTHHLQANPPSSGFESSNPLSNFLFNNTNCSTTPFFNQYYGFEMQDGLMNLGRYNNMVMFGGNNEAASCSSSDGSCSQMSFGNMKEIKQENMSHFHQSYPLTNGYEDEQKFILDYGSTNCGEGYFGNPNQYAVLQDYDNLEEVKQLISRSRISNNNNSGSFYFNNDENKTYQRTMYFD